YCIVSIRIRITVLHGEGVAESVGGAPMMSVWIPVQPSARPVENPIEGLTRSRIGIEHQESGEAIRISYARCRGTQNQVAVARQDAHMVAVLVERMLPTALPDSANQDLLAWMHVRIAVVGLVRIFGPKVRVHEVGHRAAINEEVLRVVGLSRDLELASWICNYTVRLCCDLRQCLAVNIAVHFRPLKQVFPVVVSFAVVVGVVRQPEI